MAWFKVDDNFHHSAKVLSIPREIRAEALGLWILAGTWSADNMTDGYVPHGVLNDWPVTLDTIQELVNAGLWKYEEDGIRFHDWCEYQPTREQLESRNAEKHAKKVAAGIKSGESRRAKSEQNQTGVEQNRTNTEQNLNPEPVPEPIKNTSSPTVTDFDSFWSLWPRKEGKANALKAYEKSLKKIPEPELLDKARLYVTSPLRPDVKFVPHAATWLNGERWADDLVPVARVADPNDWMKSEPIVLP